MSRVGEKIREERMKRRISSKQLGKKCGVTESFILDVENGRKIINEKLLSQISKVLGTSIEDTIAPNVTEEKAEGKILQRSDFSARRKRKVEPLGQWEEALSNIIKKVPIYDIEMKEIKGYRDFPIINQKVEGRNPDRLIYIEAPNDLLSGFRIYKGDKILIYLHQEIVNHSISLIEYEGKKYIRKIKRIEGNKIELLSYSYEKKAMVRDLKDVKIIGRGIRVEMDLSFV